MVSYIQCHLPRRDSIAGRFVEPFVGGAAIFFALQPKRALLADINGELIDLYRALKRDPASVWEVYRSFPPTKDAYYEVRDHPSNASSLSARAARTLYLNRTCFKGMWRHNSEGRFNVGYGGQDRRWVVDLPTLIEVSVRLKSVSLRRADFGVIIKDCVEGDFLFLDPPYRPGGLELRNDHYVHSRFTFEDHRRLAVALQEASVKGVRWAMTTSSHPDILSLFPDHSILSLPRGTGRHPGHMVADSGEALIRDYEEVRS